MSRNDFLRKLGSSLVGASLISLTGIPAVGMAQEREETFPPEIIRVMFHHDRDLSSLVEEEKEKGNNGQRKLIVTKSKHLLEAYVGEELLKGYEVSISTRPVGDKRREGDLRTPEGTFYVARKHPTSTFYRALVLGYPSRSHADKGLAHGLIDQTTHDRILASIRRCEEPNRGTGLGSLIEIHGEDMPGSNDWTHGCVAVTNNDMDELYEFAQVGCSDRTQSGLDPANYATLVEIKA